MRCAICSDRRVVSSERATYTERNSEVGSATKRQEDTAVGRPYCRPAWFDALETAGDGIGRLAFVV